MTNEDATKAYAQINIALQSLVTAREAIEQAAIYGCDFCGDTIRHIGQARVDVLGNRTILWKEVLGYDFPDNP